MTVAYVVTTIITTSKIMQTALLITIVSIVSIAIESIEFIYSYVNHSLYCPLSHHVSPLLLV